MVIYAAVGGRLSLIGAVYGAMLVGSAKTYFSENFVQYWLYFIGGLFIFVVMFLPEGLAGLLGACACKRQWRLRDAGSVEQVSDVILAVEDLTVSFDGFKAVDGLNFYVEEDELRCVIGPNGAGKTTLLDMICGKTKPTGGAIRFKNYELTGMIEYQITRVGRGAQVSDSVVYEDLTVLENLEISYPEAAQRARLVCSSGATPRSAGQDRPGRRADLPGRGAATPRPGCSRTARNSGWRSACC